MHSRSSEIGRATGEGGGEPATLKSFQSFDSKFNHLAIGRILGVKHFDYPFAPSTLASPRPLAACPTFSLSIPSNPSPPSRADSIYAVLEQQILALPTAVQRPKRAIRSPRDATQNHFSPQPISLRLLPVRRDCPSSKYKPTEKGGYHETN